MEPKTTKPVHSGSSSQAVQQSSTGMACVPTLLLLWISTSCSGPEKAVTHSDGGGGGGNGGEKAGGGGMRMYEMRSESEICESVPPLR